MSAEHCLAASAAAVIVALCAVFLSGAGAAEAAPVALEGTFQFGGSEGELRAISAQIEAAIADMSFYLRPIARARLQKLTDPAPLFVFTPLQGGVQVQNAMVDRPCRYDGSTTVFTNRLGKTTRAVCRRTERGIQEDFLGEEPGTWSHEFRLDQGGDVLVQQVRVTAPLLGRPLEYSLTYARE